MHTCTSRTLYRSSSPLTDLRRVALLRRGSLAIPWWPPTATTGFSLAARRLHDMFARTQTSWYIAVARALFLMDPLVFRARFNSEPFAGGGGRWRGQIGFGGKLATRENWCAAKIVRANVRRPSSVGWGEVSRRRWLCDADAMVNANDPVRVHSSDSDPYLTLCRSFVHNWLLRWRALRVQRVCAA